MKLPSLLSKYKLQIWMGLAILLATILLFWFPRWQVSQFQINNATEQATLENQYRATLAQILGGVAVAIGIYSAWKNIKNAQDTLEFNQNKAQAELKLAQDTLVANQNKAQEELKLAQDTLVANQKSAQENLKIAQEGQITERFTRAVDQLGNDKIEIRLGGIYALEKIAFENDYYYWSIMEILTACVRKNSSVEVNIKKKLCNTAMDIQTKKSTTSEVLEVKQISLDIQAILTVIVRRKYSYEHGETKKLNFQGTNLQQINFYEANLSEANLSEANLSDANLSYAYLSGADLSRADLSRANLLGADLSRAELFGADLSEAFLPGANFRGAIFSGANLSDANLSGADLDVAILSDADLSRTDLSRANLFGAYFYRADLSDADLSGADLSDANLSYAYLYKADLSDANLSGADLSDAELSEADLSGADLSEADLFGADNLTVDQLSKVKTLYNATLDPELEKPLKEKYPALFDKPDD